MQNEPSADKRRSDTSAKVVADLRLQAISWDYVINPMTGCRCNTPGPSLLSSHRTLPSFGQHRIILPGSKGKCVCVCV